MGELISVTDGRIVIRPPQMHDAGPLLAEAGDADCGLGIIAVTGQRDHDGEAGAAAGWVACDVAPGWLAPGEVLLRYRLQPVARQSDYALRTVQLLMHHLATRTAFTTAWLRVGSDDPRSLAVAQAAGFTRRRAAGGELVLSRPVPPVSYTDGTVTIRQQQSSDLARHRQIIEDARLDWLREPAGSSFGGGPRWCFGADRSEAGYVAYVDCDLASEHVPPGEAKVSYVSHPAHRGEGNVSRSVRLLARFLRDHTGARSAHLITEAENEASLRVARAVAAAPAERWRDSRGRAMVRHVLALR